MTCHAHVCAAASCQVSCISNAANAGKLATAADTLTQITSKLFSPVKAASKAAAAVVFPMPISPTHTSCDSAKAAMPASWPTCTCGMSETSIAQCNSRACIQMKEAQAARERTFHVWSRSTDTCCDLKHLHAAVHSMNMQSKHSSRAMASRSFQTPADGSYCGSETHLQGSMKLLRGHCSFHSHVAGAWCNLACMYAHHRLRSRPGCSVACVNPGIRPSRWNCCLIVGALCLLMSFDARRGRQLYICLVRQDANVIDFDAGATGSCDRTASCFACGYRPEHRRCHCTHQQLCCSNLSW